MARFEFLTTWRLAAPRERVWEAIIDVERWPEWWRGVESVESLGGAGGAPVGQRFRCTWRSRVPYPLTFEIAVTEVDPPYLMSGEATGDLQGTGCFRLFEAAGLTAVTYQWNVDATRRWMRVTAPLLRGVFAHNHDVVMGWGGEGLARRLGDC